MAITKITPQEMGNYGSFGQELGQSLGTGLQGALQGLTQAKLGQVLNRQQKMQQQQQQQAYANMGFSPQQIEFLQQFPVELQEKMLRAELQPGQIGMPQQMQQSQPMLQDLLEQQPQNAITQNLGKLFGNQQMQQAIPQQAQRAIQPGAPTTTFGQRETPQMQLQRELAGQKEQSTQQRHIDKTTQSYLESLHKEAEEARKQNEAFDIMEELGKEPGKLNSAAKETILDKLGLTKTGILASPESQLYRAINSSFMGGARSDIGGRVAVQEMQQFMKRVPSLLNTPEGRQQIIDVWRILNAGKTLKENIANRLIEENNNNIPKGLRASVNKAYDQERVSVRDQLVQKLRESRSSLPALPSATSIPQGTIYDNDETKQSVKNVGNKWISVPYRGKK